MPARPDSARHATTEQGLEADQPAGTTLDPEPSNVAHILSSEPTLSL
jgi:hypothetical protein